MATKKINGVYHVSNTQQGNDPDAIKFTEQDLTSEEKAQARENIGAAADDIPAVKYVAQTLTDAQKAQARTNINAPSVADLNAIGNGSYVEAWDGASTPVVADIPAGVVVTYNTTDYTGTLAASASTVGKIYLVSTGTAGNYDRYITEVSGSTYSWTQIGTTAIDLSDYATKEEVSQLSQEVNGINTSITQNDVSSTASSRWVDDGGKVASSSSGVLRRVEMIPVVPGANLALETTLSYATNPAGFICDNEDNILVTIPRVDSTTSYNGVLPIGAARLYVNYVTDFSILITKNGKQDALTFDNVPIEGSNNPVKSSGIYPISADVSAIKDEVYGDQFEKSVSDNLVTGTGIEKIYPEDSMPLLAGKTYKLEIFGDRSNGTRLTIYFKDETGARGIPFRIGYIGDDLDTKADVFNYTIGSTTSTVIIRPSANTNRLMLYAAGADVKDTTELTMLFSRQKEGIEKRVGNIEEKIGEISYNDALFSENYKIWTVVGGKVSGTASSYENQRIVSPITVEPGGKVSTTQSILGTGRKAIFADNEDNVILTVPYNGYLSEQIVPENATRLYLNRSTGSNFECIYQSAASAKFENIISGNTNGKYSLPLYAPSPQNAADGQDGELDAENSTSDQVFAKCDEAIAKYKNYAVGEVVGKDATNTYDIKRYSLCRADMFAWKASDPFYAWETGGTTRYIKSCSPRVGDAIFDNTNTAVATVASFDSTTGIMVDSGSASYSRLKSSDIPADVIYTTRERFTYQFDIYQKNGTVITRLETSAWDSATNTISYNSKTYSRARFYDWNSNCKGTIVLWGNEHAAQSDPHEPSIILYRLIRDLCQGGPSNNKFLSFLKNYCKVIVLPIVNPYGFTNYAISKNANGRLNGNGVNINRNYPTTGWVAGSGSEYGGAYGGSEIETQYVINSCIEFEANIGVDIHCLSYITEANENSCAYGGNFSDIDEERQDVISVGESMLSDYSIKFVNYGNASETGIGEGKNWLLANGIEGGLIEMNAGEYALQYDGKQHTAFTLETDYTLLLRMLNLWNNRYSSAMNLYNYVVGL